MRSPETLPTQRRRRRPPTFLVRHYVGAALMWFAEGIQGEYQYEVLSGPTFDGEFVTRPIPASWERL